MCLTVQLSRFLSLRQLVYFITSSRSCQALFSTFFEVLSGAFHLPGSLLPVPDNPVRIRLMLVSRVSQTAHLLYHTFHLLSTTFLSFLNCLNCIFKMYSCDSSVRITQSHKNVNCFFIIQISAASKPPHPTDKHKMFAAKTLIPAVSLLCAFSYLYMETFLFNDDPEPAFFRSI